ncbi:DUF397 domain-containing protein [Nonomuraea purpurea]|uniref:DUF397 domain-containing protein n=1 Tax=Nonomuraea purpurea TaxID=1849276 RepID=A0ABV8G8H1_9ACTN
MNHWILSPRWQEAMSRVDLSDARWIKSSLSNGQNNCVEVAVVPTGAGHVNNHRIYAVRDSKDPHGPALVFTPDEWRAFVGGAKLGEFDLE